MKEVRSLLAALMAIALGWGAAAQAQQPETAANKQTQQATQSRFSQASGAGTSSASAGVKGSGTPNFIAVWTSSSTISNSILSQSSTNVNVGGGLTAFSLSGNGSGVTNVNALTLGGLSPSAFAQLGASSNTFTGSVGAASFSGSGSGLTNVNASTLGGLGLSAFAQVGISNTFAADQTINGHLTLSDSINNSLTLQGNVTDSSGESANVIGGFGGTSQFPGNSVASGVIGATIAGGGGVTSGASVQNTVTADWGTVGGGSSNTASASSTVAGGFKNTASGPGAAVGGGNTPPPRNLPFDRRQPAMSEHPGRPLEPQQRENLRAGRPAGPMRDQEFPPHPEAWRAQQAKSSPPPARQPARQSEKQKLAPKRD